MHPTVRHIKKAVFKQLAIFKNELAAVIQYARGRTDVEDKGFGGLRLGQEPLTGDGLTSWPPQNLLDTASDEHPMKEGNVKLVRSETNTMVASTHN